MKNKAIDRKEASKILMSAILGSIAFMIFVGIFWLQDYDSTVHEDSSKSVGEEINEKAGTFPGSFFSVSGYVKIFEGEWAHPARSLRGWADVGNVSFFIDDSLPVFIIDEKGIIYSLPNSCLERLRDDRLGNNCGGTVFVPITMSVLYRDWGSLAWYLDNPFDDEDLFFLNASLHEDKYTCHSDNFTVSIYRKYLELIPTRNPKQIIEEFLDFHNTLIPMRATHWWCKNERTGTWGGI